MKVYHVEWYPFPILGKELHDELKKLYYKPKKQKLDEFLDNFEEATF